MSLRIDSLKFGSVALIHATGNVVLGTCEENRDAALAECGEEVAAALLSGKSPVADFAPLASDCFRAPRFYVVGTTRVSENGRTILAAYHATPDAREAAAHYANLSRHDVDTASAKAARGSSAFIDTRDERNGPVRSLKGRMVDALTAMRLF